MIEPALNGLRECRPSLFHPTQQARVPVGRLNVVWKISTLHDPTPKYILRVGGP
jgi:hypothetical protein